MANENYQVIWITENYFATDTCHSGNRMSALTIVSNVLWISPQFMTEQCYPTKLYLKTFMRPHSSRQTKVYFSYLDAAKCPQNLMLIQ